MGSRNRAKLAFDAFRRFASPRIYQQYGHSISIPESYPAKFSSAFSVSRGLGFGFQTGMNNRIHYINPYMVRKRFYGVQHLRPRGGRRLFKTLMHILINLLAAFIIASGLSIITIYFLNLETVAYTKRKRFVLSNKQVERRVEELLLLEHKNEILPASHPDSVRVRLIVKGIIEALQRDLGHDDDKWVRQFRKKIGSRPQTSHLDGLKWEVLVVNKPSVQAFCVPGGKIVVYTGLLECFKSDAEIATILGHEVAHLVARHGAESWTNLIAIMFLSAVTGTKHTSFFFQRRQEMEAEADYIGLMLVASAGYDPRLAPPVYEKLEKLQADSPPRDDPQLEPKVYEKLGKHSPPRDVFRCHPPGMMRAKLLSEAHVMEEALSIYRETVAAGCEIRNDNGKANKVADYLANEALKSPRGITVPVGASVFGQR